MKRLWIADIHANRPAFEAVLRNVGTVDETVFLGDIVGYGPHPSACIDLLIQLDATAVLGNHDAAVLKAVKSSRQPAKSLNWDHWTADQIGESQRSYLASLPQALEIAFGETTAHVLHHPAGAPYFHPDMAHDVFTDCLHSVSCKTVICGHSHRRIDRRFNGQQRFVCIPSVGQPRNRDPRAAFALECDGTLMFGAVAYDVETTVTDFRQIGFEAVFRERWIRFLRTGYDREWSSARDRGETVRYDLRGRPSRQTDRDVQPTHSNGSPYRHGNE